jgi:hypothetical protein
LTGPAPTGMTCCFVSVIGGRTRSHFAVASRYARTKRRTQLPTKMILNAGSRVASVDQVRSILVELDRAAPWGSPDVTGV